MVERLALCLVLTLIFELGFALAWGAGKKNLLLLILVNVLTNPLVVLWHDSHIENTYFLSTLLPEVCAVIVEAVLLKAFGKQIRYPVLLAVCMNIFSYSVGVLISCIMEVILCRF